CNVWGQLHHHAHIYVSPYQEDSARQGAVEALAAIAPEVVPNICADLCSSVVSSSSAGSITVIATPPNRACLVGPQPNNRAMIIPELGRVTKDDEFNWYRSEPIQVPVLGDKHCRIIVEGYDEDPRKEEFHTAVSNFLTAKPAVLADVAADLFRYYQDCNAD